MSVYERCATPTQLAAKFASYMSCPSTVRARVKEHFGRAPTVEQCANLIEAAKKPSRLNYYFRDTRLYDRFDCDHEQDDTNLILTKDGEYHCLTCYKAKKAKKAAQAQARAEGKAKQQRKDELREKVAAQALKATQSSNRSVSRTIASTRPAEVANLIKATARTFGVTVANLMSQSRDCEFVKARMVLCVVLRERGHSYPKIAEFTNRKDHTSIRYLCNEFPERAKRDPFLANALTVLRLK